MVDTILEEFRARAEAAGTGYQIMINEALKEYPGKHFEKSVTESTSHRILQTEGWNGQDYNTAFFLWTESDIISLLELEKGDLR